MDELFGDHNNTMDEWLDSIDSNQSNYNNRDHSETHLRPKTTTIEKVLDLSPIKRSKDNTFGSVNDNNDDKELSFDKNKSSRKYFKSSRQSIVFSPKLNSTPKPSKSQNLRRSETSLKKKKKKRSYNYKLTDLSLWDRALIKNPELRNFVDSFNEEMAAIESSELSVTKITDFSLNNY